MILTYFKLRQYIHKVIEYMSERFLIKFFDKLKPADFKKDKFLLAFYKFYKKEKSDNLFECYTEYITRNCDFKEEERDISLSKLYDDVKTAMIRQVDNDKPASTYDTAYTEEPTEKQPKSKQQAVKISKSKALETLSDFIKQSFIVTYEDPDKEYDEKDEAFMESTTTNIIDEIQSDGRVLPEPKKDVIFGQRSVMLTIWQDTRQRCAALMENELLIKLVSKLFYINTSKFTTIEEKSTAQRETAVVAKKKDLFVSPDDVPQNITQNITQSYNPVLIRPVKQQTLDTVLLKTDNDKEVILPVENFVSCYTNNTYNTSVSLSNNHPMQEVMHRTKQKNKSIYICSGSQNICGGNADQGIDVAESMLYMTSSYSMSLERALHAFPIKSTEILLCPNVLVFKDPTYKILDANQWQKIAVMMLPGKYRPKTNLKDPAQDDCEMDARLYDLKTEMSAQDYDRVKANLVGSVETSLFFGYDTIILDDLSISDNWLPAHQISKIIRETITLFKGRVKEFVVCANKAKSFNVIKLYLG